MPTKTTPATKCSPLTIRRKSVGLSLQDIAIEIGSERSTIFKWETGQQEPATRFRKGYAKCLKLTVGELGAAIYEGRRS